MILAPLSTPLCELWKKSECKGISLMTNSITSWSKILNLLGFTFYLRFTKVCIMFLADPLFQIIDSIKKISLISRPSFTTYSSESEFIHKGYKSFFTENYKFGSPSGRSYSLYYWCCWFYLNIPHEDLASLRKFLDVTTEKKVTTEFLLELAGIVLKNNTFQINEKKLKQLR